MMVSEKMHKSAQINLEAARTNGLLCTFSSSFSDVIINVLQCQEKR